MKRSYRNQTTPRPKQLDRLLSTLAAVSGSLVASPGTAVQLGDVEIQSTLGESLRASIAYELRPGEQIMDSCVSIRSDVARDRIPFVTRTQISVNESAIVLHGASTIREPLMIARLVVDCPPIPYVSREFVLFIDPPKGERAQVSDPPALTQPRVRARPRAAVQTEDDRRPATEPVRQGSAYRVRWGDTLSEISHRLEHRQIGLWLAADAIFEANPAAFVDADPNKLRSGSVLMIPDFRPNTETVGITEATPPPEEAYSVDPPVVTTEPDTSYAHTPPSNRLLRGDAVSHSPAAAGEATTDEKRERDVARVSAWGIVFLVALLLAAQRLRKRNSSKPEAGESTHVPHCHWNQPGSQAEAAYMIDTDGDLDDDEQPDEDGSAIADSSVIGSRFDLVESRTEAKDADIDVAIGDLEPTVVDAHASSKAEAGEAPDTDHEADTIAVGLILPRSADPGSTIVEIADQNLLEQDYEDDFQATQALSEELEQAAAALERDCGESVRREEDARADECEPTLTQLPHFAGADAAPALSAQNDDIADAESGSRKQKKRH